MSLKAISRYYREHLRSNTSFAAIQAVLCPSCPALIHINETFIDTYRAYRYSLEVLTSTPSIVGIPTSGLDFLGCPTNGHFKLLASSNGLLCICYTSYHRGPLTPPPIFFIANPATQESYPIPGAPQHLAKHTHVGLVYDPLDGSIDKQKFMIVQALPLTTTNGMLTKFRFVTFSSNTGQWVMSDTSINAKIEKVGCDKVVCANGILYWDCEDHLLWSDVTKSVAGNIKMPWKLQGSNFEGWERHSIDVSNNGMLLCTTIDKDGLAMYKLVKVDGQCWELKHKKGWKDIMELSGDALQFCHSMKLRNRWRKFYERWSVRPLGVESGQWVYLMLKVERKRSHKVLRYHIDTGKVDNFIKESGPSLACIVHLDTATAWLLFHQFMCQHYKMEYVVLKPVVAHVPFKVIQDIFMICFLYIFSNMNRRFLE
ncbi:hypothetical protein HU200_000988 [Digitaria exilis]|uniref:F-box protein At3g26010-like beta-propeller domain-containing protein n=1 Tax=Digitaria exilis TaxID=1010633 RepID=A0A835G268_9POAL|nr:hypothetical protein HU200_000988 [Digitaria exilis]